jgi:hypothetical protein
MPTDNTDVKLIWWIQLDSRRRERRFISVQTFSIAQGLQTRPERSRGANHGLIAGQNQVQSEFRRAHEYAPCRTAHNVATAHAPDYKNMDLA